jgi:N-methylhydantoinase A
VTVATVPEPVSAAPPSPAASAAVPARHQAVRDTATGAVEDWAVYDRASLAPGATLAGPAIIAEDETSTLVGPGWSARIDGLGYIRLTRGQG